jgi:hypothetical protein
MIPLFLLGLILWSDCSLLSVTVFDGVGEGAAMATPGIVFLPGSLLARSLFSSRVYCMLHRIAAIYVLAASLLLAPYLRPAEVTEDISTGR